MPKFRQLHVLSKLGFILKLSCFISAISLSSYLHKDLYFFLIILSLSIEMKLFSFRSAHFFLPFCQIMEDLISMAIIKRWFWNKSYLSHQYTWSVLMPWHIEIKLQKNIIQLLFSFWTELQQLKLSEDWGEKQLLFACTSIIEGEKQLLFFLCNSINKCPYNKSKDTLSD